MTILTYSHTLVAGTPEDINDVQDMFEDVRTLVNGNLDDDNLSTGFLDKIGVTSDTTVRRGSCIVATEEARTNTAYGLLTTADRVQNVVLPANGLIFIVYNAMWKESVLNAARGAIFIGSNQLKIARSDQASPVVQETSINEVAGSYEGLGSSTTGLISAESTGAGYSGDVTTGQIVGYRSLAATNAPPGICAVFAAAGTYDISVQFKASSGSVTVKERKLWVWTMGF